LENKLTSQSKENSFEKEKIGLINENEEEDAQRRVSNIATELVDGFNLNDDSFLNQQFNRRKGSNFIDGGSAKFDVKSDSFIQEMNTKLDQV
jgi:hypothetical protein